MLKFGYMDDEGAFSIQNLRAIKSLANKHIKENRSIMNVIFDSAKNMVKNIISINEEGWAFLAIVLCGLLSIICSKKRRLLLPLFLSVTAAGFYLYLNYIDRIPIQSNFCNMGINSDFFTIQHTK